MSEHVYKYMYVFMSVYVCIRDYIWILCYSEKGIQMETKVTGSNSVLPI